MFLVQNNEMNERFKRITPPPVRCTSSPSFSAKNKGTACRRDVKHLPPQLSP